jgi:cysteine desulfurase/selenocysteine lyase
MINVQKIRQDFPILKRKINGKRLIYFDNAATSQKPRSVIKAIVDYYYHHNANVHRGVHQLADEDTTLYENGREKIATFLGASPQEIVFTRNATEAINLVALAWGRKLFRKEDLVLLSIMEHHSNLVCWQRLKQELGIRLEFVPLGSDFSVDEKILKEKLNHHPKMLALTHVSNVLGTVNPLNRIIKEAHRAKTLVLVDAAQSVPHLEVNFRKLSADFLAFSGHKMLGPMGIGGLVVKEKILQRMPPLLVGGGMVNEVKLQKTSFATDISTRFEAGTPNVAGIVGLAAAVEYLEKVGMKNISRHEQKLNKTARAWLKKIPDITLFPTDFRKIKPELSHLPSKIFILMILPNCLIKTVLPFAPAITVLCPYISTWEYQQLSEPPFTCIILRLK